MKIRNGFVSNSSSSSFVVLGYKGSYNDVVFGEGTESYKDKLYKDLTDEERDEFHDREDVITDDGCYYVGELLAESGFQCDYIEEAEFSAEELQQKIEFLTQ